MRTTITPPSSMPPRMPPTAQAVMVPLASAAAAAGAVAGAGRAELLGKIVGVTEGVTEGEEFSEGVVVAVPAGDLELVRETVEVTEASSRVPSSGIKALNKLSALSKPMALESPDSASSATRVPLDSTLSSRVLMSLMLEREKSRRCRPPAASVPCASRAVKVYV